MVMISKEVFCWLFSKTRLRRDRAKQSISGPAYLQSRWFVTLVSFVCLEQHMLFWICPLWYSLGHGQNEIKCRSETYILIFFIVSSAGIENALWFLKCAKVQTLTMFATTESVFEQKHISFSLTVFRFHIVPVLLHWNSKFSSTGYLQQMPFLFNDIFYISQKTGKFLGVCFWFFCCLAMVIPFCVTLLCTIYTELLVEFWYFQVVRTWWSFLTCTIALKTFMVNFNANISIILLWRHSGKKISLYLLDLWKYLYALKLRQLGVQTDFHFPAVNENQACLGY